MSMSSLQELREKYGIHPDKTRGQNFLTDKNVLKKIITAAELQSKETVIEIGAGTGALTEELAQRAGRVIAFEVDKKLAPLLKEKFKNHKNVEIIENDILKVALCPLLFAPSFKVVSNIPYNITSAILEKFLSPHLSRISHGLAAGMNGREFHFSRQIADSAGRCGDLSSEHKPSLMVLLVQREVAERVCAPPGEMSFLSVMVQYYGRPKIVARVPAVAFFPPPKVESAILKIIIKPLCHPERLCQSAEEPKDLLSAEANFFRLVKLGFSHRRQTLKNNFKSLGQERVAQALADLGLKPTARAQELTVNDWQRLFTLLNK